MDTEIVKEDLRKWFKDGGWNRYNTKGEKVGKCARDDKDGDGKADGPKPKCLPASKAASLGKKKVAAAVKRKRAEDPNPDRTGAAKNVKTESTELELRVSEFMEACWKGYEKKGMKTMFGKRYPNCVKKTRKEEVELDEIAPALAIPLVAAGGYAAYKGIQGLKKKADSALDNARQNATLNGKPFGAGARQRAIEKNAGVKPGTLNRNMQRLRNSYEPEGEKLDEFFGPKNVTPKDSPTGTKSVQVNKKYPARQNGRPVDVTYDKSGNKSVTPMSRGRAGLMQYKHGSTWGMPQYNSYEPEGEMVSERSRLDGEKEQREYLKNRHDKEGGGKNPFQYVPVKQAMVKKEEVDVIDEKFKSQYGDKTKLSQSSERKSLGRGSSIKDGSKKSGYESKKEFRDQSMKLRKHRERFGDLAKESVSEGKSDGDPCWDSHKQVGMKKKGGKMVPNCVPKEEVEVQSEGAAWTKKSGKNESGGLNEKGRKSYERENPGSDLKRPSKKVGNKRRASFCARMKGMRKRQKPSNNTGEDRLSKSLRAWNC